MVATDIRCNSGEIAGESLSNLLLIFNKSILMFVFKEYWISTFCFVVQKRSKNVSKKFNMASTATWITRIVKQFAFFAMDFNQAFDCETQTSC